MGLEQGLYHQLASRALRQRCHRMENYIYFGIVGKGEFGTWNWHTVSVKYCCLLLQMKILHIQKRARKQFSSEILNCFETVVIN